MKNWLVKLSKISKQAKTSAMKQASIKLSKISKQAMTSAVKQAFRNDLK